MLKSQVLCFVLLGVFGCLREPVATQGVDLEWEWDQKIRTFSSCQELNSYVQRSKKAVPQQVGLPLPVAAPQHYDNQTENVLEGDILQSNESYFFLARQGSIEIIEKLSLESVKSIPVALYHNQRLILTDEHLTYIGQNQDATIVKVFELEGLKLSFEKILDGAPVEIRVKNDQLIVVGQKYSPPTPEFGDCTKVYQPNLDDFTQGFTFVHILNLKNERPVNSIGLAGRTDHLMVTNDEILLFTNTPHSLGFFGGPKISSLPSHFRVIQWQSGELTQSGLAVYSGIVKDRWAVSQSNGNLFLAASFYENGVSKFNNIQVFQRGSLTYQSRSESEKFGINEDIRAVSYQAGKAYVVTFEKTDPLFVIDLTDVDHLKILAEVKAPGFSTQLRPLKEGVWSGLGFQAHSQGGFSWLGGLQFSVFNLQDLASPFESARLEWGARGSGSEATFESKALFSTKSQDRVMFPVVLLKNAENSAPWEYSQVHEFSGAIILDIQKDQVNEAGRVSHREWREKYCGQNHYLSRFWWNSLQVSADIQRIIQNEQGIYSFSRFGVMKTNPSTLQEVSRLEFKNDTSLCSEYLSQ